MIYFDARGMGKLPQQFWGKEYWVTLGFGEYLHFLSPEVHKNITETLKQRVGDNILDEKYADIAERITARATKVKSDSHGFVRIPKELLELAGITEAAEFILIETPKGDYYRILAVELPTDVTGVVGDTEVSGVVS